MHKLIYLIELVILNTAQPCRQQRKQRQQPQKIIIKTRTIITINKEPEKKLATSFSLYNSIFLLTTYFTYDSKLSISISLSLFFYISDSSCSPNIFESDYSESSSAL